LGPRAQWVRQRGTPARVTALGKARTIVPISERFRRRWERDRERREIAELERFALSPFVIVDPESSAGADRYRLVR